MLKTTYNEFYSELCEILTELNVDDACSVELFARQDDLGFHNFIVDVNVDGNSFCYSYDLDFSNELEKKRFTKRYLKLSLYRALSEHLQKSLPWGSLTGIRPTKLAYQLIDERGEFENSFCNQFLVSRNKTELVKKILTEQKPFYERNDANCNFFVSVPFCPSRCAYCSFLSCEISKAKNLNEYVNALVKEIEQSKKLIDNLRSVYLGGGTPVSLPISHFEKIMDAIGQFDVEYTVEAGRPDAINKENLQIMKDHGVTRVCVNPQTFCDSTLERLGRRHTARDIYDKYELVKSFGFDVNMDFIAGLIGEDYSVFTDTIERAIKLEPENITVHTLALKRGSVLKNSVDRLSGEEVGKMVEFAHERLQEAGYNPYYLYRQKYMAGNLENTGYAKKGKQCIYNIDIMEELAQIIACGANGVSKRVENAINKIERYGAPKDIATYIDKLDKIIEEKKKLFGK